MVQFNAILSTAALVALVPSLVAAAPVQSSTEDLVEREPFLPLLGLVGSLFGGRKKRDLEDDDLAARLDEL
jgi:hypothetical protein